MYNSYNYYSEYQLNVRHCTMYTMYIIPIAHNNPIGKIPFSYWSCRIREAEILKRVQGPTAHTNSEDRIQNSAFLPNLHLSFFFSFFGPHPRHIYGGSRLEVKSELQLPAYTIATARQDPSQVCNLHHSSWQCQILNPLSKAKDPTCILMGTSWVR